MEDLLYMCDKAFTKEQFLSFEEELLELLDYNLLKESRIDFSQNILNTLDNEKCENFISLLNISYYCFPSSTCFSNVIFSKDYVINICEKSLTHKYKVEDCGEFDELLRNSDKHKYMSKKYSKVLSIVKHPLTN